MSNKIEVKVPDIGDFKDVPIIEVAVQAGDAIKVDQTLIVLESDKASMDVPSTAAGTIVELKVKVGDKVSEGAVIAIVEASGAAAAAPAPAPAAAPAAAEEEAEDEEEDDTVPAPEEEDEEEDVAVEGVEAD
uniref:biotin/lipoyl-containing protein n=1 Tax=Thauera aminoaromatica TaxID=164330 RepID=UPI0035ADBE1F